jgi:hypothetical protein
VVEQDGVFAHDVVDRAGCAAESDDVFADGVEAEECFLVVDQVELEQGRGAVYADLGGGFLDEAQFAEFGDVVDDGQGVAAHDLGGTVAELGAVGQIFDVAGERHGRGGVGDEDADVDGLGGQAADSDFVEWFLHDALQGLSGEAGEVDDDVLGVEGAFDVGTQADGTFGAFADEDPAALPRDDESFVA